MVDAMTKSELIERLANKNARLAARDVDESVKAVLDAMTLAMATGSRIEIRGFGSFCLNYRPERLGRNPKSGETMTIAASKTPKFKAGKALKDQVNA